MAVVAQIENFLDKETVTLFKLEDLQNIIIDNLGVDIWNAIIHFTEEKVKTEQEESPSMITYVEDGIFAEQIRESDVIKDIVENIIIDLQNQDYLKKSKNVKKFKFSEDEMVALIDEKLSPGMMNYFESTNFKIN